MKRLEKSIKFLDLMVKVVFISTFIFTMFIGTIIYLKDWEQLAIVLTEKWFDIMVRELIVMGFIQVIKLLTQAWLKWKEMKLERKLSNE